MDNYIGHELDKRYEELKADMESKRTKTVIYSVLQAYLPDTTKPRSERLDPIFRAFTISQIRLFVFVGHDSTSSTICSILHLLATNPNTLPRVRAEHDRLLGRDFSHLCSKSIPISPITLYTPQRSFAPLPSRSLQPCRKSKCGPYRRPRKPVPDKRHCGDLYGSH